MSEHVHGRQEVEDTTTNILITTYHIKSSNSNLAHFTQKET